VRESDLQEGAEGNLLRPVSRCLTRRDLVPAEDIECNLHPPPSSPLHALSHRI